MVDVFLTQLILESLELISGRTSLSEKEHTILIKRVSVYSLDSSSISEHLGSISSIGKIEDSESIEQKFQFELLLSVGYEVTQVESVSVGSQILIVSIEL